MRKYTAILTDLERQIAEGRYRPGQRLPSVRSAATAYRCSVSTITRAYAELEQRHVIYAVPQSGFFVVEQSGDWRDPRDPALIDFATVLPDLDAFPYRDFQHCLNQAIDSYKYDLFTYGRPQGLASFVQTLVSHLANDQVFTSAQRIVVTSGAQQALQLLARMPFPSGKRTILVEQPSYDLYLRFLETEDIPVAGIPRTAAGLDMEELEQWFKGGEIKFFYTMPRYHNPLGISYTTEERRAIVRLAARYDVYIVEDDYMADLGTERSYDPLYSYDGGARVIYVKSFSKIIFPGLRVGAVVLPEALLPLFHAFKLYPDTSLLSQAALEIYMKNGMYERHKHRIASLYASRMEALYASIRRHPAAGLITVPDRCSGIYMPLQVKPTVNLDRLTERLAARSVRVISSPRFYHPSYLERDKFLRLSISQTAPEQIERGVAAILEELRQSGGYW